VTIVGTEHSGGGSNDRVSIPSRHFRIDMAFFVSQTALIRPLDQAIGLRRVTDSLFDSFIDLRPGEVELGFGVWFSWCVSLRRGVGFGVGRGNSFHTLLASIIFEGFHGFRF